MVLCGELSLCSFWHRSRGSLLKIEGKIFEQKLRRDVRKYSPYYWPNMVTNNHPLAVRKLTQDGGSWLWKLMGVGVSKLWLSSQKDILWNGKVLTLVYGWKVFTWLPSSSETDIQPLPSEAARGKVSLSTKHFD